MMFFCLGVPPTYSALQPAQSPLIRVRVARNIDFIQVRGVDLRVAGAAAEITRRSSTKISCGLAVQVKREWRLTSPSGFLTADFQGLQQRRFRDELRVVKTRSSCDLINILELEHYLDGLVGKEFSPKWAAPSIDAQVIAARTYALESIQKNKNQTFDVEGTTADQVYEGASFEDYRSAQSVVRTRGQVLTYRGRAIKAFYHSTCGGETELPERVWGRKTPGFSAVSRCSSCRSSPAYEWSIPFSREEIESHLRQAVRERGVPPNWSDQDQRAIEHGALASLKTLEGAQHRNRAVLMTWSSLGKSRELRYSSAAFRSALGVTRIKSTAFSVHWATNRDGEARWVFSGRGNGHGVGMCQWGAKGMAEKGASSVEILKHYYPNAKLARLW